MLRRQRLPEYWYISGITIQFINSHTWQFKQHTHRRNIASLHHDPSPPPHTSCTHWAGILAEKSSWEQANRRQKLGLVRRNRTKISQIINAYLCLPFFLLIILWLPPRPLSVIFGCSQLLYTYLRVTRGPLSLFSTYVYRGGSHRRKSAACPKFATVWLCRSPIPVGRRGVISSFKWFLPAFATRRRRGGGRHPVT